MSISHGRAIGCCPLPWPPRSSTHSLTFHRLIPGFYVLHVHCPAWTTDRPTASDPVCTRMPVSPSSIPRLHPPPVNCLTIQPRRLANTILRILTLVPPSITLTLLPLATLTNTLLLTLYILLRLIHRRRQPISMTDATMSRTGIRQCRNIDNLRPHRRTLSTLTR